MSLNGLDSIGILEAYHAALAEGGAWYVPIEARFRPMLILNVPGF